VHTHRPDRSRRRLLTPESECEPIRRHRLVRVQEKHRQDGALLDATEPQFSVWTVDFERSKNPKVHW
jgi:hypothetical protein